MQSYLLQAQHYSVCLRHQRLAEKKIARV